ncbi:MAG: hypothetical protein J7467_04105 [Chloroflexus sp.]|jgi:hypothetical protein|nr:hypothetical protein [Chloroflexus sp.]
MSDSPQQSVYYTKQISPETEGASTTALWLEIVFGLFSLLGIGHVYTGRIWLGIALLIAWWVYDVIAITLSLFTLGFASCLFLPIYIAVPIISGIQARTYLRQTGGKGDWGAVGKVVGGGCLVMILAILIFVFALGGLGWLVGQQSRP